MTSDENMREELERLKAENEALRSNPDAQGLRFKVSAKGAVSVYGLGRFPVTLYQEQWDRLLASTEDLKRFIDTNRDRLKKKEK
jgi:hypothetical protein